MCSARPPACHITVSQGEVLPAAPRGFTWRRVEASGDPVTPVGPHAAGAGSLTWYHHRAAAALSASRASTQVPPPPANSSLFQNGALVFSQSIRNAVASSAGWRWAAAARRHDVVAGDQPADPVDHRAAEQFPAPLRLVGDARDGSARSLPGSVPGSWRRRGSSALARTVPTKQPMPPMSAAPGGQRGEFRADVEILGLHADPGHGVSLPSPAGQQRGLIGGSAIFWDPSENQGNERDNTWSPLGAADYG